MRMLLWFAALALLASPAVPARNPNAGHGPATPHLQAYVLRGTLSHYSAMSGTTPGTITIAVQVSSPATFTGQTLTFLDPNPSVSSLVTTNQVSLSSKFGKQTEVWTGFDVSMNYRRPGGITIQGGIFLRQ